MPPRTRKGWRGSTQLQLDQYALSVFWGVRRPRQTATVENKYECPEMPFLVSRFARACPIRVVVHHLPTNLATAVLIAGPRFRRGILPRIEPQSPETLRYGSCESLVLTNATTSTLASR